ncbi:acetate--CoA ligase [Pseudomonadota bacterium]
MLPARTSACSGSSFWRNARAELNALTSGGLNIAYVAVDRHAKGSYRDRIALRFVDNPHDVHEYSYGRLAHLSDKFANVLQSLEIGAGDCVATLLDRVPELYIAALGTLKNQSVFCPLFSAFGTDPIQIRLSRADVKVLVTSRKSYESKVASIRESLPNLKHVLIVDEDLEKDSMVTNFWHSMDDANSVFNITDTDPETPALLHFTSGTTGTPKAALHVHDAVVAHYATAKLALDLRANDVFWCTADPGWVTGVSYGIIAPLVIGATLIIDRPDFDVVRWCRILQDFRVNVWYSAPTAVRMMMRLENDVIQGFDFSSLRFMASVGEPLNAEAVNWSREIFGVPICDNWWQTETGAIMIANYPGIPVKPGSMGKPLPGIKAEIVDHTSGNELALIDQPEHPGELALDCGWPSMFRSYLHDEDRYNQCFVGDWYLTGDIVTRDEDGYFWFIGRADDAIKSAGHLIGPFEIERVLLAHPAVADAAVIGMPDAIMHELVRAYIVLKPNHTATPSLQNELRAYARTALGPSIAPRQIKFIRTLPKTRSGKIMRRLLRARALNLPEGDLSTLDTSI